MKKFYTALDTLKSRPIRTVINIETAPILELLRAERPIFNFKKILNELKESPHNFINKLFVKQFPGPEIIINLNSGDLVLNTEKFSFPKEVAHVSENDYNARWTALKCFNDLEFLCSHQIIRNEFSIYRQGFIISNRDKVRKRFFKRSARNWHLKTVNILLKDDICLYTTSRNNKFNLFFPHEWKKLNGALVRQSDANEISSISECTNI